MKYPISPICLRCWSAFNAYATHEPVSHDDGEVELNTFAPFFRVESRNSFSALGLCREIDELRMKKDFEKLLGVGYSLRSDLNSCHVMTANEKIQPCCGRCSRACTGG